MAEAGVYKQGQLASSLVGTPGVDRSAGAAYRTLAGSVEGLRAATTEANRTGMYTLIEGVTTVGKLIANKAAAAAQKRKQQDMMLEDIGIADAQYGFERTADDLRRQYQNDYLDRPQEAEPLFREALIGKATELRERFASSPRALSKLVPAIERTRTSQYDQMGSWVRTRRTAQAQAMSTKTVQQSLQEISFAQGSFADKIGAYEKTLAQANEFLLNAEPVLGAEEVGLKRLELSRKAGPFLFNNMMSDVSDDAKTQLKEIADIRYMLDNNDSLKVFLESDDKLALQNKLDAMQSKAYTELQNDLVVNELDDTMDIGRKRIQLDTYRNDPALQSEAISWAGQRVKEIQAQSAQIDKDPKLADKAKIALKKMLNGQVSNLDTLVKTAHANLRFQETEASKAASEAKADQREARRETREAEQAAREKRRLEKETTIGQMDKLRSSLKELMVDPLGNRDKIINLGAQINRIAKDGMEKFPESAATFLTGANEPVEVARTAAKYKPRPAQLFGLIPGGVEVLSERGPTPAKAAELKQREQQFVTEMLQKAEALRHADQHKAVNSLAGLNAGQQSEFDRKAAAIRQHAKEEGWSTTELNLKLNTLRNRILERGR